MFVQQVTTQRYVHFNEIEGLTIKFRIFEYLIEGLIFKTPKL